MGINSWSINQRSHHWGAHPVGLQLVNHKFCAGCSERCSKLRGIRLCFSEAGEMVFFIRKHVDLTI